MPFPKGTVELAERGYRFKADGRCSKCHAKIQWWYTPVNRLMPLRADTLIPHFADCTALSPFRKYNAKKNRVFK